MVGAGVSAVAGILLVAIVTNGFSQQLAGTLFAATSAFLILNTVTLLGTDTGLVRSLPQQLQQGRPGETVTTLRVALVPVIVFSALVGVALFIAAPALAEAIVGADDAETMTHMLRLLAPFLPVAAVNDALLAATRGFGTMIPTVTVENIGRLALQPLLVLGVLLADLAASALALAWSLPYAVAVVLSTLWLRRLVRRRVRPADPRGDRSVVSKDFWKFTTPRAIANVVQTGLKRSDILLVAALAGPADAALYTAATRFVVVGQLGVQALQQAMSPHLSALFAAGDKKAAQQVFQAATAWMMLLAWPIYLVCATSASLLLSIFGPGYTAGTEVVVILCLTMLFATASGPVDSVLLMAGRSWLSLLNNSVALALNVGLNLVLIPRFGINGAAISWAIAIVVRNVLPMLQIRASLGMTPGSAGALRVGGAALLLLGGLPGLVVLLDGSTGLLIAATAVGAVAYLGLLWRWREVIQLTAFAGVLTRRRQRVAT